MLAYEPVVACFFWHGVLQQPLKIEDVEIHAGSALGSKCGLQTDPQFILGIGPREFKYIGGISNSPPSGFLNLGSIPGNLSGIQNLLIS